jgi:site-specific DNA recombinase
LDINSKRYDIRYVATYLRKSRAESMEDLEKHRLILNDLCHKSNFKFVEYKEVGTSDSIEMRPKISKLLTEVEDRVYDAVCVVEYDRLSRGDMGDQDRIAKIFKKSETLIITPDKIYDLNNDIDDEMVEFKGFLARREYKMITKRLRQGKKIGSRQGQWTNGTPPFPYVYQRYKEKCNPKGLVIDDEKYIIYREIIDEALNGVPPQDIAHNLNRKGILTSKSKYWSGVTVLRLLLDETHLGKIISNKTQGDAHKIKRSNAKPYKVLPKSEWVIVENCHEAVKTQEEHDQIIRNISERTKIPKRCRKKAHIFSGLIKCGVCGHILTFYSQEKEYIKPCWYVDALGNKCRNKGLLVETLEQAVLSEIRKYKDKFMSNIETEDNTYLENLTCLKAEKEVLLNKYQKALEIVNEAYELGDYSRNDWLMRKEKWQKHIEQTTAEIYDLKKQILAIQQISNEERLKNLSVFFDNITTTTNNSQRNDLYRMIINCIVYKRDGDDIKIKIEFK